MTPHAQRISHAIRLRQLERELGLFEYAKDEHTQRALASEGLARWLALPIRYDNDPRSHRDGAIRVNLRLSAHARTLGGVADYSSVPEAA